MVGPYDSINLITQEMQVRGFTMQKVRLDGTDYRMFAKGSKLWITPIGYVKYPFVTETLKTFAHHKNLAYDYVAVLGYQTPKTVTVNRHNSYKPESLATLKYPLIIKPNNGAGSYGVVRNIPNAAVLAEAVAALAVNSEEILVQEQFNGQEIRLTVVEGMVASVVIRDIPKLVGDGSQDLAALLASENAERAKLHHPYITYPQLTEPLISLPNDMTVVPGKGEIVSLGASTMISGGASVYSVGDDVHASYKSIACDIVSQLKAPFMVVDLLVTDYTLPATDSSYVFLECNTAPALKLYYSLRNGIPYDILPVLGNMVEAAI